jgi:hypothetical protein
MDSALLSQLFHLLAVRMYWQSSKDKEVPQHTYGGAAALDGGEWSASRPGRALPPGKEPSLPIAQEAGWGPEPVWTQILDEKFFASAENRTWITR